MIKAVLFDYGGVITAGGGGNELSERLATNLGVTPNEAWDLLMPVWGKYRKGLITEVELWQTIEKQYGKSISSSQRNVWNSWEHMQPRPEMVQLIERLKATGLRVGLLSDTIPNTAAEIRAHGGYQYFDPLILSYEVKQAKPDREIYETALQRLNLLANEVVFIDDQERCLTPARQLGMHTILCTSSQQTIVDITVLLKSENNLDV